MNTLTEAALQYLVDSTFVDRFELFESIESTNDRAKELARDAPSDVTLIISKRQMVGRGRGGNRWQSSEGSLTFSLLLPASFPLPEPPGTASLWSAIAICEAVRGFLPEAACGVKWPNDVFVQRRKVGGLLLETVQNSLVAGVGLNVVNDLQPYQLPQATTMAEQVHTIGEPDRQVTLSIINVLMACIDSWQQIMANANRLNLPDRWRESDLLAGQPVTVTTAVEKVSGTVIGVDESGALLIETPNGVRSVTSGTVDW